MNFKGRALYLIGPRTVELREQTLPPPPRDRAVVEVLGCALCPTDRGLYAGTTQAGHPLPLVLGHQTIGRVLLAWERFGHLVGRPVLVPARVPCGACPACRGDHPLECAAPQRLGCDLPGGFATHMSVPASCLIRVEDAPPVFDLRELAPLVDFAATGGCELTGGAEPLHPPAAHLALLCQALEKPSRAGVRMFALADLPQLLERELPDGCAIVDPKL